MIDAYTNAPMPETPVRGAMVIRADARAMGVVTAHTIRAHALSNNPRTRTRGGTVVSYNPSHGIARADAVEFEPARRTRRTDTRRATLATIDRLNKLDQSRNARTRDTLRALTIAGTIGDND